MKKISKRKKKEIVISDVKYIDENTVVRNKNRLIPHKILKKIPKINIPGRRIKAAQIDTDVRIKPIPDLKKIFNEKRACVLENIESYRKPTHILIIAKHSGITIALFYSLPIRKKRIEKVKAIIAKYDYPIDNSFLRYLVDEYDKVILTNL